MSDVAQYIKSLFAQQNIIVSQNRANLFDEFIKEEVNVKAVKQIQENQKMMKDNWALRLKIKDIIDKQFVIPNATVNKKYEAILNLGDLGLNDIIYTEFENLETFGLVYNNETEIINGTPIKSGDYKIKMKFRVVGENDDSVLNEKQISLIINADPKSLWKVIPSDLDKDEEWKQTNYWKPDNSNDFKTLGNKNIVVASKRGRSHANVGSFRDDDFGFKYLENNGWSIVCVADGAGSAKLSRQGSSIACKSVIEYFESSAIQESFKQFDQILFDHNKEVTEESSRQISSFVYDNLSKAAFAAHKKIEEFANSLEVTTKELHTTLIFTLFKKYEFGYAILSFGVGDCPIGLINKDLSEIKLMNWLDVGEFGGGTRFITMPEIFTSDKFSTRFGFKLIEDFSYLFLMTDGIYDPKFVVEANLEKIEKWREFLSDLEGNNEDKISVSFDPENVEIANQLSAWMDFWSPGNHDDRTLAIVF